MEILGAIPVVGGTLAVIIPFIVVLAIVVFVHEYGHYIVGRWCGIRAETFSIGFGPSLLGWIDKRGTRWQVAALPLGGFVRFVGDMDPSSAGRMDDTQLTPQERKEAFHNASLGARAATVLAGPVFNFLLTFFLFIGIALVVGKGSDAPVIGDVVPEAADQIGLEAGDRVIAAAGAPIADFNDILKAIRTADGAEVMFDVERDGARISVPVTYRMGTVVGAVSPGQPASRAGIAPGDKIVAVDGTPVTSFFDLQVVVADKPLDRALSLTVERDGSERAFTLQPIPRERPHPVTGERQQIPTIGVSPESSLPLQPTREAIEIGEAVIGAAEGTWRIVAGTVTFLGDLIFANADTGQLGGPIKIAQISGEQAEKGLLDFVQLIAIISTSIGLINLFPIPVLDGGHLMFYAIEAVRGRPAGEKIIRFSTVVGLSLVLLLMVFATYNDLLSL